MINSKVLLTGASGNLGQSVLRTLNQKINLVCLTRKPINTDNPNNLCVFSNILDRDTLGSSIDSIGDCSTIIHLAGITDTGANQNKGSLSDNIVMATNIVELAKKINTKHLIFVSSNAVNYSQRPYAKSKYEAEQIIKNSGISYTIIRPTLIINHNSPEINEACALYSKAPFIPLPNKGKNKIQPIHVEDVATFITMCVNQPKTINKTYSIGGGSVILVSEFMQFISQISGKRKKQISIPQTVFSSLLFIAKIISYDNLYQKLLATSVDVVVNNSQAKTDVSWSPKKFSEISQIILRDYDQT